MSLEFLADPNVWLTLVTLSALEIVLGIDNLVFISIAVGKLPEHQRNAARKFGIAVACITRIAVSYTHLDVYKRQGNLQGNAGWAGRYWRGTVASAQQGGQEQAG